MLRGWGKPEPGRHGFTKAQPRTLLCTLRGETINCRLPANDRPEHGRAPGAPVQQLPAATPTQQGQEAEVRSHADIIVCLGAQRPVAPQQVPQERLLVDWLSAGQQAPGQGGDRTVTAARRVGWL